MNENKALFAAIDRNQNQKIDKETLRIVRSYLEETGSTVWFLRRDRKWTGMDAESAAEMDVCASITFIIQIISFMIAKRRGFFNHMGTDFDDEQLENEFIIMGKARKQILISSWFINYEF